MADPNVSRPFVERAREAGRLGWLAIKLSWRASPPLLLAILALSLLQAVVPTAQLVLSRAVFDRLAFELGLAVTTGPLVAAVGLGTWIPLNTIMLAVGRLLQPIAATFQGLAGDRR